MKITGIGGCDERPGGIGALQGDSKREVDQDGNGDPDKGGGEPRSAEEISEPQHSIFRVPILRRPGGFLDFPNVTLFHQDIFEFDSDAAVKEIKRLINYFR